MGQPEVIELNSGMVDFFKNIYLFIWLHQVLIAACGIFSLHCSIQDFLVAACGIQFPDQGLNRGPLHYECRVLAAGPPGKSLFLSFFGHVTCGISVSQSGESRPLAVKAPSPNHQATREFSSVSDFRQISKLDTMVKIQNFSYDIKCSSSPFVVTLSPG